MNSKRVRTEKKEEAAVSAGADTFIERLRKARAVNCSPSYIGMNEYICNKVFNKLNLFSKF